MDEAAWRRSVAPFPPTSSRRAGEAASATAKVGPLAMGSDVNLPGSPLLTAPEYVHLHLHTHYSILDGVCQIEPLVARAKELGMKSLAVTDHGAMYGAIDFYTYASKAGVKPIVGFEAYVAPGSRFERDSHGIKDAAYHLTLLARNFTGYRNLSKLCTAGFLEGFYYRPRVDKEILRAHAEGITALSGCLSGEVSRNLLNGRSEEAETAARQYREIFGEGNFFLEIQNNGLAEQAAIIPKMDELSRKLGIPLVATSDVHYILPEHARVQDALLCINTGKLLSDENRMRMGTEEFYLKSAEQMRLAFPGHEAACDRTLEIAATCNLDLNEQGMFKGFHLPQIKGPDGGGVVEYFETLCRQGLRARYGDPLPEAVEKRYEAEKEVIVKMGFPSYFLMVWEIVNFARKHGIPVGTRGSAAGSIVAYALKISNLDPLSYGLLFERFLNEGRNEMPDIDLDIDKERRQEVVDFVIERFGRDHCAQIVTFGKISAKSAVRDVGRVMGVPLPEVDAIAKMIPDVIKPKGGQTSIQAAMELNPDLKELHDKDARVRELLDLAATLDGVIRQTGIHAAGVLVCDRPIVEYGPLATRGGEVTTQYDMKKIEKMGLCKVDCLGLETLTLLRKAVAIIKDSTGAELDLDQLPLEDPQTYDMFGRGDTKGVFQFESSGMRDLLIKLKPDCIDHLNAACAMYRPGPMQFIDQYIACRHGREKPNYLHPKMEPILRETYGLIVYQEQVQALARELAHFTLSEGDLMRRAMGKKIQAIMDEYRGKFIKQAADTVGSEIAEKIFDQIDYFAGYGFNKSHSACYAVIAYQTAYLKCHYPREYMAALLTTNRGDTAKIVSYIDDAKHMDIAVLPPDLNESDAYFTVTGPNLRFGLAAVKGVGDKAVEGVVEERRENGRFKSLHDFCSRVDLRLLNKGTIEALIEAGAFDSLGGHRAQYLAALESALAAGGEAQRDRATGQMGLFAAAGQTPPEPTLPNVPPWADKELLTREKKVLGFYVSSHPLAQYAPQLTAFGTADTGRLLELEDKSQLVIGGVVVGPKLGQDKNEKPYLRFTLEDTEGTVTVWVFTRRPRSKEEQEREREKFERIKRLAVDGQFVFVQGYVDRRRDEPSVMADDLVEIDKAETQLTKTVLLTLNGPGLAPETLDQLSDLLRAHKGPVPICFKVRTAERKAALIRAGREHAVAPSRRLAEDVGRLLGAGHLAFSGRAV